MALHQDCIQRRKTSVTAGRIMLALLFLIAITTSLFAATGPVISLSPASLDVGSVSVGSTSAVKFITLTNTGDSTLNFSTNFGISGNFAFGGLGTCTLSVPAGSSCTISVKFTPTATGTRTGAVTLTDNAAYSPQAIPLTGTGVSTSTATFSPTSIDFGSVAVGSTSSVKYVTVTNTGSSTLTLSSKVAGDYAFGGTGTCGTSLAKGGNCTVSVKFAPTTSGTRTGSLTITNSSTTSPVVVALTGTGAATTSTVSVAVSPASASLQVSKTQQFAASISGSSNTAVTWSVNGTTGGNSTVGTITSAGLYTAPAAVPSGGSVTVKAIPAADATKTASATIAIAAAPSAPSISTSSLPSATVSTAYSANLAGTGGTTPYSWALASGSLPGGTSISTSGTISGTPTAAGTYSFSVRLTDATGQTATKSESLVVASQNTSNTNTSGNTSSGPTYYVATNGNDSNPGTQSAPWATIQKAANTVPAGATVIVADGTYTANTQAIVSVSRSGSSSAWITFKSQNKWGAKLVGNNYTQYGFKVSASYIVIDGFEITGLTNSNGGNDSEGIEITTGTGFKILHNHIHHIGNTPTTSAYGQNAIWTIGSNVLIDSNLLHDIGRTSAMNYNHDHGVYVDGGSSITVQNNVMYNLTHGWGLQLYPNQLSNLVVINNTIDMSQDPNVAGAIIMGDVCNSCVLANNIWYMPRSAGLRNYTFGGSMAANNNLTTASNLMDSSYPAGFTASKNVLGVGSSTLFMAPGSNYHLQAGSPAIGAGTTVQAPALDFDGKPRSSSSNDIGAYAY